MIYEKLVEKSATMSKETRLSSIDMAQYRERLMSQKEFLTDILSKIDKQILALQVERLHLRNSLLGSKCSGQEILPDVSIRNNYVNIEPVTKDSNDDLKQQKLDLSVKPSLNDFEEFEDDDLDFLSSSP
ncbi:uncharacterized protein LOC126849016 [Cataglyphis hispanica]|uniref:uncharacterized protein LOC126849016 n=1 Tax=Cataglyphis hispanica TaxID=1086592 RepID=UPI00218028CD|nr:uncharacterized protein LOC126849016 [Cataglyphis hispanica]